MEEKTLALGITFDDVLLLPGYTDFKRAEVDLTSVVHPSITLNLPIFSSPMDTVTEKDMAVALGRAGGMGIIHRNLGVTDQATMVSSAKNEGVLVGAAVGAGADFEERVAALVSAGVHVIVVDSGHGNSKFVIDSVVFIKQKHPGQVVMAGNVATYDGAKRLIEAGADIIRVGMGPGSICTTRIISGMGVPQLTAISEAVRAVKEMNSKVTVVADGGIRQIGDMAKALAAGAHAVMLGSLLAGYDESPGEIVERDSLPAQAGKKYKHYRGMGSVTAMQKGSAERYGQSREENEKKLIAEGVEGLVAYKGPVADYLTQIAGSLKSSFYYIGGKTLADFQSKATFIRITESSLTESHPHNIDVVDAGSNYTL